MTSIQRTPFNRTPLKGRVSRFVNALVVCFCVTAVLAHSVPVRAAKVAPRAKTTKAVPLSPAQLIAMRAQRVLVDLKRRPLRPVGLPRKAVEVESAASKTAWLEAVYGKNMVDASFATEMLSDKRVLAEVLERELGPGKAFHFYPRTIGLREFLVKRKLIDAKGTITADGDELEAALNDEFPAGYLVRPAVGVAPHETARGLYPNTDLFVAEVLAPGNILYSPSHLSQPVKSHILNSVASGEAIVLQENFINSADVKKPLKSHFFQQVRVHTYEDHVIEGGIPDRWVQANLVTSDEARQAEAFVREFLVSLPLSILTKQAWGIDVAVMDNGELRIIDVVTNRGKAIGWSSYLDQPRVIAAYSKHFEESYGLRFTGVNGALIRHGFANYMPFWEKRIEKARPGLSKALAYLPPMP